MIAGSAALMSDLGLVGSGPHPFSLTVNGDDLIARVPMESIAITEAGPGAVSSMHFTIWDTDASVTIGDGAEIILHDNGRDLRCFGGFLERWSSSPAFGGSGRILDVSAYGYEALLDLVVDTGFDIAATAKMDWLGNFFVDFGVLQSLCGITPLRAFAPGGWPAPRTVSSQATPIGTTVDDHQAGGIGPAVTMAGQSIRQAFETFLANGPKYQNETVARPVALTVDFYRGVRAFNWVVGQTPSDYATLTIGAGVYASNLQYEEDHSPGAIVNAVFVQGAAAASTGWVVGDTTTGRREAYTTTASTFEDDKLAAAAAILDQRGSVAGRGSLDLENYTPTNVHPGSRLIVTDANMGWSSNDFFVSEISKTFNQNGNQNWHVSFFDVADTPVSGAPSLARDIRRLTRGTAF